VRTRDGTGTRDRPGTHPVGGVSPSWSHSNGPTFVTYSHNLIHPW